MSLVQIRRNDRTPPRSRQLTSFLPTTREEMNARGWKELDILIVNGDADPVAGSEDARWFRSRLADARSATVDGTGRLALVREWRRILDHVAPLERGAEGR